MRQVQAVDPRHPVAGKLRQGTLVPPLVTVAAKAVPRSSQHARVAELLLQRGFPPYLDDVV